MGSTSVGMISENIIYTKWEYLFCAAQIFKMWNPLMQDVSKSVAGLGWSILHIDSCMKLNEILNYFMVTYDVSVQINICTGKDFGIEDMIL